MQQPEQDPSPSPNPSSFLRDISNFRTPKASFQNPNPDIPLSRFPLFFTSSKQTSVPHSSPAPSSSAFCRRRHPSALPSSRSKAARRLKALEIEQSQSSRKAQIRREKSIKACSRSLSVWLNFLFKNPRSCGCDAASGWDGGGERGEAREPGLLPRTAAGSSRKRDSIEWGSRRIRMDRAWRSPKRQRNCWWRAGTAAANGNGAESTSRAKVGLGFTSLEASLRDVCSFEDLVERMGMFLSPESRNEVLSVMSRVVKNIDEGRLKMKAHCPIVTDVGLKEEAIAVLMCYNIMWLRIGLHIVFGGDSLLPNEDNGSDQDGPLLRMIIDKHFFSQSNLAKCYSYNKKVEGLYRPGYFEALGSVILKRFLLLVLVLDRAKCQSMLPLKYGIDGKDGGSPLLFNCWSHIKSSRQVIYDFLSKAMHGEGDLLAHLVIIGYKLLYQQPALAEYDFVVTNIFEDFQDGVRLCRTVQLLLHDSSILMKIAVPSDAQKKNLVNCGIAMQYLKQAGVPLFDEDGVSIGMEDIANGDKELTLALLWNMFIYLQVPLLINRELLLEEISKIKGSRMNHSKSDSGTHLGILLEWIQAVCNNYNLRVDALSSLVDGKALCCLVDYYFRNRFHVTSPVWENLDATGEYSLFSNTDNTVAIHNFVLVQKVTTILGNIPEVVQVSDILDNHPACNERSVIILSIFLSSILIGQKEMDQLYIQKLMAWNCCTLVTRSNTNDQTLQKNSSTFEQKLFEPNGGLIFSSPEKSLIDLKSLHQNRFHEEDCIESDVKVMQAYVRGSIEHRKYLKIKAVIPVLQAVIRAWLIATDKINAYKCVHNSFHRPSPGSSKFSDIYESYYRFMIQRHAYVKFRKSVLLIQQVARAWIKRRHQWKSTAPMEANTSADLFFPASTMQSCIQGRRARSGYALIWSKSEKTESTCALTSAAIKIQIHWRSLHVRRDFLNQQEAIIKIQSSLRRLKAWRKFKECRKAAIVIQRVFRGCIARKKLLGSSYPRSRMLLVCSPNQNRSNDTQSLELKKLLSSVLKLQFWWKRILVLKSRMGATIIIQSHIRGWLARHEAYRKQHGIVIIQKQFRGWLVRRKFLHQMKAIVKIQSYFRGFICWKKFHQYRVAAFEIQRFIRGQIARNKFLGASSFRSKIYHVSLEGIKTVLAWNFQLEYFLSSVVKLQKWWRKVLRVKLRTKSAITIQTHVRGWKARQESRLAKERIIVIQSYWRGTLVRKGSKEQLLVLRSKMQKSAANVQNSNRLMNRLVSALSELLSDSVSNILHTCATLDMATEHSQKCCEALADAGAIDALLKQIRKANRSAPHQEILKHAFSTLRNLIRYPHLARVFIKTNESVETIFWEMLRNKGDVYFVVSDLLKKLCSTQEGLTAVCMLPAFLKRLNSLADDLDRKANLEMRNPRLAAARGNTERRLREAVELLQIVTNWHGTEFQYT